MWFVEMVEECIHYSYENKRKFDIVASMGMAMLGDEELQGFVAKPVDIVSSEWENFGYYIDEKGYRRYGTIPNQQINVQLGTIEQHYNDGRPRTSDPRAY
ncbi:MAG: hypothetical protein Nk1A_8770 [Endomicrobiia bacterium]|nr:MAG: hypothetical protein Nk1A_8770 [Endomicrobiia bacterium]